ncbi:MAG: type II and III secretion system protein family protein [Hyphomicrobiales bacterium]|nr:type II and III secretion system protein family protein [Hyphomicrobiales bacterium]
MGPGTAIRAAAFAGFVACLVGSACAPGGAAHAAELRTGQPPSQPIVVAAGDYTSRFLPLGKGKSVVIDLPRDIKDVLVADPKIANAVIRSSRRAYIVAVSAGATNIFFFDSNGAQIAGFDIAVTRDVSPIRAAIQRIIPDADIKVEGIGDGIILTGTVANQAEAQQACDVASHFVAAGENSFSGSSGAGGSGGSNTTVVSVSGAAAAPTASSCSGPTSKVVNSITVRGRDQVMLKVTVAEMDRTVIKQLGINLSGSVGYGTAVVNFNNPNAYPINGTPPNSIAGVFKNGLTATMQAMEQAGVVRTLAEPTLTAISGESAHFLAGGMFPYPIPSTNGEPPGIAFQNFGVGLTFSPVVLSGGRISLHVSTEVSQLNSTNSVTVAGTTVPGLDVRRADTTVEIPSGGSLAMAGMIENQTKQDITGLPGLMEVPILGTLFKSRDYLNNQTELVVLVTPYVVRAVAQKDLSRPDDGFADPSDPASVLLGRLNRIYGVGGTADPPDNYRGKYGFILD